jgi:hypothetical protein
LERLAVGYRHQTPAAVSSGKGIDARQADIFKLFFGGDWAYTLGMATSEAIGQAPGVFSLDGLVEINRDYIGRLCQASDAFIKWERKNILTKEPSPTEWVQHRRGLLCLLRGVRLVHSLIADPDYPDHLLRERLETELWRLDQSWQAIYEPMPKAEADKLLAEVFPDERRA